MSYSPIAITRSSAIADRRRSSAATDPSITKCSVAWSVPKAGWKPPSLTSRDQITARRGERAIVGLTFAHQMPAVYPADGAQADQAIKDPIDWWSGWASRCTCDWKYRDAIIRSALTLKMLTYRRASRDCP